MYLLNLAKAFQALIVVGPVPGRAIRARSDGLHPSIVEKAEKGVLHDALMLVIEFLSIVIRYQLIFACFRSVSKHGGCRFWMWIPSKHTESSYLERVESHS